MANVFALVSVLGVALTFYVWFQRIQSVSIPANRSGFVAGALGSAALGAAALASSPGWGAGIVAGLGTASGLLFALLVWISPQKTEGAIEVGDRLHDLLGDGAALDDAGNTVALSAYAGTPMLIKFFRGHW